MSGITVTRHDGDILAVKQATDPDHRARLRHEADVLARLDHPGVVRLVDFAEGPPATLRTAFVGPDSWASAPPPAAGIAALTAIVADLHDAGITHGDLHPNHVLVDAAGHPVLCGFGDSDLASATTIATDRSALATLLGEMATSLPTDNRRPVTDAIEVLDDAAVPLRAVVRLLDAGPEPEPSRRRPLPGLRPTSLAAVVALMTLSLIAVIVARSQPQESANPPPPAVTVTVAAPTTAAVSPPATSTTLPRTHATEAGPEIEHDGRRYAIGAQGDVVVVADWACTGQPTPAVLRPTTGEVAVFSSWPAPGATTAPDLSMVVDGALDFVLDEEPCPELRVRTPDGSRLVPVPTS